MSRDVNTKIQKEFNSIGEVITITTTIQLKYKDMEISQLPENCYQCPVGFMINDCGREIPLTHNGRPDTCKLKQISTNIINKQ